MMRLLLLSALSMSVGWGFRGDFGHETGAILPGALLGLSIAMASGRADWLRRSSLIALFCGLGWAIGGQMSYGIVIGYTKHNVLADVAYGYAGLFAIGALWGGIGAAALAVSLSWPRSELARFLWPLTAIGLVWFALDYSGTTDRWSTADAPALAGHWAQYDVDWLAAVSALVVSLACGAAIPASRRAAWLLALMSAGWLAGFVLLVDLAGLRMTPPRSDNWAGCVGLFAALLGYLVVTRQRAALLLVSAGLLAGGFGFSIGDFWQTIGRAKWGPLGDWPALAVLNYWKVMEQFFGLLMGFGVALGVSAWIRGRMAPAVDDRARGGIDLLALVFLLVLTPWLTVGQNVDFWRRDGLLPDEWAGVSAERWIFAAAALLAGAVIYAAWKHVRGRLPMAPASHLGRAQWLYLILLWGCLAGDFSHHVPRFDSAGLFVVHLSFWLIAGAATWLVLSIDEPVDAAAVSQGATSAIGAQESGVPADDPRWRISWRQGVLWLSVPLAIYALARMSIATHDQPLPGSRQRFVGEEAP